MIYVNELMREMDVRFQSAWHIFDVISIKGGTLQIVITVLESTYNILCTDYTGPTHKNLCNTRQTIRNSVTQDG